MPFVRDVLVDHKQLAPHAWSAVEAEIATLKRKPGVTIFLGGSNGQMLIEFVDDKGYYVSAFAEGELQEWVVVDRRLSDTRVEVNVAGHHTRLPLRALVSEVIALEVAREFYVSGQRTQERSWVNSAEIT